MTLLQIKYILTIAEAGSMNRASEELFVSQPTLTSAVKEIESELGITIFTRTSRGVVPTEDGEGFLRYAKGVYQQYELLTEKYLNKENRKRRFGVSTQHYSFAVKAFVDTVRQFGVSRFEFAIRETKTEEVISDVGSFHSQIGILYLSDFNRKVLMKMIKDQELEFIKLIECQAYVYLWKGHPLAEEKTINMKQLEKYPCLIFEQGKHSSPYLAEEILTEHEYPRVIYANDRASMLNLMIGLNAFTLCSGIICEELNGSDYLAVPFMEDELNLNSVMEIGYIKKKGVALDEIGETYLKEMKKYLGIDGK